MSYRGWESIRYGFEETLKASTLIAQGIVKLISGVVPSSEVGGVVSIVSVIGSASQEGWVILFWLTALISVNLGILNLLPIPALDGGHIIFNCYEIIMRKPPSENVAYYLTLCGWAILLALMFLGLYNDIFRLLS
ncbi:site-2 protease family protein [Helicobacter typhlonius]|uniref:site-2 protease family protein n=1 Tax=Helicobacter typhlonius TaxID=76936 RepID=UPI003A5C8014